MLDMVISLTIKHNYLLIATAIVRIFNILAGCMFFYNIFLNR